MKRCLDSGAVHLCLFFAILSQSYPSADTPPPFFHLVGVGPTLPRVIRLKWRHQRIETEDASIGPPEVMTTT